MGVKCGSFNTQNPFSGALCDHGADVLVFVNEGVNARVRSNVLAPGEWFSSPVKFSLFFL